jgi:hypothetical protein
MDIRSTTTITDQIANDSTKAILLCSPKLPCGSIVVSLKCRHLVASLVALIAESLEMTAHNPWIDSRCRSHICISAAHFTGSACRTAIGPQQVRAVSCSVVLPSRSSR